MKKMKKKNIAIILLLVGLFCTYQGYKMFSAEEIVIVEPVEELKALSEEEAKVKLTELITSTLKLFEENTTSFQSEQEKVTLTNERVERIKVTNYKDVVNLLFTENGLLEFEQTKFNNSSYVIKQEDSYYLLASIPDNEKFLSKEITYQKLTITEKKIKGLVTFYTIKMDDKKVPLGSFYSTDIEIKLVDGTWKIEKFNHNYLIES